MDTPIFPEKRAAKDTIFTWKHSLNLGGKLCLMERPWVMGILNTTPDSFFSQSRAMLEGDIRQAIRKMLEEGADIIDVGAASTRPGAKAIEPKEEIKRIQPALKILAREFPDTKVSVDTYQSEVARAAVDMGAHMINDISGGSLDEQMFLTVAELKVPYVLMHLQGTPENMQNDPRYKDVFREVAYYFSEKIRNLLDLGVNDIILDPGFGFGKTDVHNYTLMNHLYDLKVFDRPVLVGLSRKSMINRILDISANEALNGTTVLNTIALQKGASILRVHDVKEAVEAVKIVTFTQNLD